MKILHLASEYPPQAVYGLGRFVRDLAEELARLGHSVTVLTNSMGGEEYQSRRNGVRVLRVDFPPPPKPPLTSGCVLLFNIFLLRRVLSLGLSELKSFDAVCSHDWLTAPAAQAIQDAFGVPHVCTFHDTIGGKRLGKPDHPLDRFTAQAEAWAASRAARVIANSRATKEELVARYEAKPERIDVVPCAIAPGTFRVTEDAVRLASFREAFAREDELLILYVGRLDAEKGVDVLLRAFARAKLPHARLCLAGGGVGLEGLREQARELGISERADFLGYVENPALAHLYKVADIQVCPSLYEPFGMVALEGMLQGTPVVASNTGGLADLIEEGRTGLKVPCGDDERLAQALTKLAFDPGLRASLGQAAREEVLSRRTWEHACRETLEVYRRVTKGEPTRFSGERERLLLCAERHYSGEKQNAGLRALMPDAGAWDGGGEGGEPLLPLRGVSRSDENILRAFNFAARMFALAARPPEEIGCAGWEGVLAASVFPDSVPDSSSRVPRPKLRFAVPPLRHLAQDAAEEETFEQEIVLWAAERANECLAEDTLTELVLARRGIRETKRLACAEALAEAKVADNEFLRGCLAPAGRKIVLVAQRLEHPVSLEILTALIGHAHETKLPVHWVVCGDGYLRDSLMQAARERQWPVTLTGHLHSKTLAAVWKLAQAVLVPFAAPRFTHTVLEAGRLGVPIVAQIGTSKLYEKAPKSLAECDLSQSVEALAALCGALGVAAPPPIPRLQRPSSQAAGSASSRQAGSASSRLAGTQPRELVLYNEWGLGDELMLSAVTREIKRAHPEKRLWIRSRHGFRFPAFCESSTPPSTASAVETIYQNPVLYGPKHHSPFPGHLVQQMLDKVALDTGLAVKAQDVRPAVRLRDPSGPRASNAVLLHGRPNKRLPSKDWGLSRWERLCELLHERGLVLLQAGARDEPRLPHAEDYRGLPPGEVPDLAAAAALVVTLVGFLMHVAAAVQTPAVVIYGGREHPAIDGYPEHIHLCSEQLECRGRWGCHLDPDLDCPHGMKCMEDLTPELAAGWATLALGLSQQAEARA